MVRDRDQLRVTQTCLGNSRHMSFLILYFSGPYDQAIDRFLRRVTRGRVKLNVSDSRDYELQSGPVTRACAGHQRLSRRRAAQEDHYNLGLGENFWFMLGVEISGEVRLVTPRA